MSSTVPATLIWARLVADGVIPAYPMAAAAQARAFPSDDGRSFVPEPPLR